MKKIILLILAPLYLCAQSSILNKSEIEALGRSFLNENFALLGLEKSDVAHAQVTDLYLNKNNDCVQLYFNQTYQGYKVDKALINLTIKPDRTISHTGHRFVANLKDKIESDVLLLSSKEVIESLLLKNERAAYTPEVKFVKTNNGHYKIAWEIYYTEKDGSDTWLTQVDAFSGELINKTNQTLYCEHPQSASVKCKGHVDQVSSIKCKVSGANTDQANSHLQPITHFESTINNLSNQVQVSSIKYQVPRLQLSIDPQSFQSTINHHSTLASRPKDKSIAVSDGAKYKVLALPAENPMHGPFVLVEDPHTEVASPFGWHDTDGNAGAEFTITRGNNVWAYDDTQNNNFSLGNEPEGGSDLVFDFPFNPAAEVEDNLAADVTNMFYLCNMMHDQSYLLGFDSAAGAYQDNTYGEEGKGNDWIYAESLDGRGINNANFNITNDGIPGRIQMYRWIISKVFRILSPNNLAADYTTNQANWDNTPDYNNLDFKAEIAIALDANPDALLATHVCDSITTSVTDKIALIRRGTCEFGEKALRAQEAGAVAAIICNVPGIDGDGEDAMGMGQGDFGGQITIPVISLGHTVCQALILELATGPVTAELKVNDNGPGEVSSGFDNTIIAHEYAHGISTRLIGGPSNVGCLSHDEQMGEGISDYFALIMTTEAGDKGSDIRGMGNYVEGLEVVDRGYRRYPYSTDMNICPLTMDHIIATSNPTDPANGTHAVGEVWAAVLWDIYWAFTELYGWTTDWTDDSKGNVKAMKLAINGMKSAPCLPTFIDMRDAIFEADDGAHTCLLWSIFARRGMGYLSEGNDPFERDDNVSNYEPLPTCVKTLKIKKELSSVVTPGAPVPVILTISNHLDETANAVTAIDILSEGLKLVPETLDLPFALSGDTIFIELGDLVSQEVKSISYVLETDPSLSSVTKQYNAVETAEELEEWQIDRVSSSGTNVWELLPLSVHSGDNSWTVFEVDASSDQKLEFNDLKLRGERPTLRFWHQMHCTPVQNGGFVEYSLDGQNWLRVNDRFVTGGYNNPLPYANLGIAGIDAFSGYDNDEFEAVYLDFSDLKGETIQIRFRFATYDYRPLSDPGFTPADAWFIDDLELMDLKTYEVNALAFATNADTVTTGVQEIIIDSNLETDRTESLSVYSKALDFSLHPNPTDDFLELLVRYNKGDKLFINLTTLDGQKIITKQIQLPALESKVRLDVSEVPEGFYLLQLSDGQSLVSRKVVVQ